MGKWVTPFRVGLLVIVSVAALIGFMAFVDKGRVEKDGAIRLHATFRDASGLGPKSRVQIAGIPVGEVEHIDLVGNRALITFRVSRTIQVKSDARLIKRSESLLGDFLLDLDPGSEGAEPMANEGTLTRVEDMTQMEQTFDSLSKMAGDLKEVTAALRGTLGGDQGKDSLAHIVGNLSQMSDSLNKTVLTNGERLDAILTNFQGISEDIRGLTGSEEQRFATIIANVQTITEDVKDVLSTGKKMLGQGEGSMTETVTGLKEVLAKLDRSLQNLESITGKVNQGEGTLGQLINDKRLGQALTDTVVDASGFVSRLVNLQTEVTLRSEFLFSQRSTKNYLRLNLIPKPDKFYTFEIVDDPRGTTTQQIVQKNPPGAEEVVQQIQNVTTQALKYSVMFNKRYYFTTLRFGIIESTGGVGADFHFLDDSLTIKFDAFEFAARDKTYPRLKAYANYSVLGHVFFTGGVDDSLNAQVRDPSSRKLLSGRDIFLGGGIYFTDDDLTAILQAAPIKF